MEMVLGKRAAPSSGGGSSPRTKQQGPSSTRHTHTCWATRSAHSGASSFPQAPGRPDHGHMYTHAFIGTYVHTDVPSAHQRPLGHRHWLRIRFSVCMLSSINTQPMAISSNGTQPGVTFGHTGKILYSPIGVSRPQFAR